MSDLVETVARALAPKAWKSYGHPGVFDTPSSKNRRTASLRHARGALAAIESSGHRIVPVEPTEEMIALGAERLAHTTAEHFGDIVPENFDTALSKTLSRAHWNAMLAAAPKVTA